MSDQKTIVFIKNLLLTTGLVKEREEFDENYVNELAGEAEKRLAIVALDELGKEKLAEYGKLVAESNGDPEVTGKFFQENIPNFSEKMEEALKTFTNNFIERTKKIKESFS